MSVCVLSNTTRIDTSTVWRFKIVACDFLELLIWSIFYFQTRLHYSQSGLITSHRHVLACSRIVKHAGACLLIEIDTLNPSFLLQTPKTWMLLSSAMGSTHAHSCFQHWDTSVCVFQQRNLHVQASKLQQKVGIKTENMLWVKWKIWGVNFFIYTVYILPNNYI